MVEDCKIALTMNTEKTLGKNNILKYYIFSLEATIEPWMQRSLKELILEKDSSFP